MTFDPPEEVAVLSMGPPETDNLLGLRLLNKWITEFHGTGLSEVIAALLILVIAVAMGTIFFAYGTTVLGLTESEFIRQTALSRDKIEERIVITSIFIEPEDGSDLEDLLIAVFNYGGRAAEVETVYLGSDGLTPYDYDSGFSVCSPDSTSSCLLANVVSVGDLVWIRIDDPTGGLMMGTTYNVVIATARGNSFELLFKA